jgi:hypothetical protein
MRMVFITIALTGHIIVGFPASLAVGESESHRESELHRVSEPSKSYNNTLQHSNPSSKMKTTDEYKAAVANAIAFKHENLNENTTTAARIHRVNARVVFDWSDCRLID